jgi:Rieske Fe-S protein
MKWYRIPEIQDIDKPFIKKVIIAGKSICLSLGECENRKIICPVHGYSFDLQTGKGANDYLKTYPVKIKDNVIYVGTKSVWDDIKHLFSK